MKANILSEEGTGGRAEFLEAAAKITGIIEAAGSSDKAVNVVLIESGEMAELNRKYKKREGEAEILTFSYQDDHYEGEEENLAGEIYLCYSPIKESAEERGVEPSSYLLRLVVHGICHLMGYSHGEQSSAEEMEEEEMKRLAPFVEEEIRIKLFS